MTKESAFSDEYDVGESTESKPSIQEPDSMLEDKESKNFIKEIESAYKLSKPRRNIIRARIITE
jgi:hypothetical protein